MTMQRRVTIELKDILALEYGCGKCGSRHTIPIDRVAESMMKCPNCHYGWIKKEHDPATLEERNNTIPRFVQFLKELAMIGDIGPDKNGVTIRFEIQPPQESSEV